MDVESVFIKISMVVAPPISLPIPFFPKSRNETVFVPNIIPSVRLYEASPGAPTPPLREIVAELALKPLSVNAVVVIALRKS